jgi:hypothetical protein
MLTITDADAYIAANCIDVDDWNDADDAKKQRLLNVAERTITKRFPSYTIPDNAVYEFANALAIAFNDTNKLQQQGVSAFSISGVASFQFEKAGARELAMMIPQAALDLIGEANGGIKIATRRVGRSVI